LHRGSGFAATYHVADEARVAKDRHHGGYGSPLTMKVAKRDGIIREAGHAAHADGFDIDNGALRRALLDCRLGFCELLLDARPYGFVVCRMSWITLDCLRLLIDAFLQAPCRAPQGIEIRVRIASCLHGNSVDLDPVDVGSAARCEPFGP